MVSVYCPISLVIRREDGGKGRRSKPTRSMAQKQCQVMSKHVGAEDVLAARRLFIRTGPRICKIGYARQKGDKARFSLFSLSLRPARAASDVLSRQGSGRPPRRGKPQIRGKGQAGTRPRGTPDNLVRVLMKRGAPTKRCRRVLMHVLDCRVDKRRRTGHFCDIRIRKTARGRVKKTMHG